MEQRRGCAPLRDRHMTVDRLRRKLTVRSNGQSLVLIKGPLESAEHVIQKALLWAMYLPSYPHVRVEVPLPQPIRYKPDLLALDDLGEPQFWGECGEVSVEKLRFLLNRFRSTHFVFSRWHVKLAPYALAIQQALPRAARSTPIELINFPESASDWIRADGTILVDETILEVQRWSV